MTAVHFKNPLQTTVLGLIIEVFASPEALAKVSQPIPEDKAQAIAKLIADDMRDNHKAAHVSTIVAAGLLDEPSLTDKELDISVALEHISEQYVAANPGTYSAALTMTNNGLDGICFPQLKPENTDEVSNIGFCIPFGLVGGVGALDAFEENFFQKDMERLHFADERIVDALMDAFGLEPGELKAIGYEDLDYASEALGAFSTNAKFIEIERALKDGRQAFYMMKSVPVFVAQNHVRVAFLTFDAFARRMPHLEPGGDLEEMYIDFQRDFRFVVDYLTSEGHSPFIIKYPSSTGHVKWEEVLKAKRLDNFLLEDAHPGLKTTDEGEAAGIDVICMTHPDDHSLIAATISKLNEEGMVMATTNLYPLSIDAMTLVVEYAKAIAQREGLELDITEGGGLYVDHELRALSAPPYSPVVQTTTATARVLH
jgi:hypothetical protein